MTSPDEFDRKAEQIVGYSFSETGLTGTPGIIERVASALRSTAERARVEERMKYCVCMNKYPDRDIEYSRSLCPVHRDNQAAAIRAGRKEGA